ncbi:MAG: endonuclease, partial [Bacteroidales bacterium]|nr:endonuclease [Bacteroidales bacterium]
MSSNNVEMLINIVKIFLNNESSITRDVINSHIEKQCGNPPFNMLTEGDKEQALKSLLSVYSVWMNQKPTVLSDNKDHIEWLDDNRKKIDFAFWDRYQAYLEKSKNLPYKVISSIDKTTDTVLKYLEDPNRKGEWDRRGMVVGEVQSGKTSNYTGLICKAVDSGYKLIIVLAGMHNNLRSQTQLRIDEGFCGRDTRINQNEDVISNRFGAGLLKEFSVGRFGSMTNSLEKGDFNINIARSINFDLGGDPVILVVKKNASVLKSLINWLKNKVKAEVGDKQINNIPLLVIDDEADNASVNGKA